jgi:conjugative transfer region lipoprotein (TIGR03751 family)
MGENLAMQIILKLITITILTNAITGCSSMVGNVVPQQGKTMEQVYDGMKPTPTVNDNKPMAQGFKDVSFTKTSLASEIPSNELDKEFKKIMNPELKMYVYPHVSGNDEVPIPGYYTAFNGYSHDHYMIKNDLMRRGMA